MRKVKFSTPYENKVEVTVDGDKYGMGNEYITPHRAGDGTPYNSLKLEKTATDTHILKPSNWGRIYLSNCVKVEG